ncbi:Zn-dependent hydrolase, partial [Dickeya dianthicola]|uniref:Zn-dependent hydrolase n=1 Tax=Dickeya dianthicola TaxID=204039 RepID=UPI0018DFC9C7
DVSGVTVAQALTQAGLNPDAIAQAARPAADILAYLELHIEQGPCLEQAGLALGVVTAINGARRLNCTFTGHAGHAGTVPMSQRQDALAAAATWMTQAEQITRDSDPYLVATFGALQCLPGAANVIPGEVRLTLDIRGPDDKPLDALLQRLLTLAQDIAVQRGCAFSADEYYRIAATRCDDDLQQRLSAAVTQVQGDNLLLPSGAGHDAIAIAESWPVGMLFMRCKGGISHHPDESVLTDDVALALQALLLTVWGYR